MKHETTTRKKAHAVFFAMIMVISMVAVGFAAGPVAATGDIEADDFDRIVEDGNTVYQGQQILINVEPVESSDEENLELRRIEDDAVGTLVSTPSVDTWGTERYAVLNTQNRETGNYILTNASSGTSLNDVSPDAAGTDDFGVQFENVVQDLNVEFDEEEVGDVTGDSEVDVEIESDIRNSYAIVVSADDLDADDLENIFTNSDAFDYDRIEESDSTDRSDIYDVRGSAEGHYFVDDDDDEITILSAEGTHTLNFTGIDTGSYEFEFEVFDSTAEDSASIEVVVGDEGAVTLVDSSIDQEIGSIVEIELEAAGGANEASIVIGDEADIGYQLNATVDFDGEDSVTLLFNTYTAGNEDLTSQSFVLEEDGENDAHVTDVEQSTNIDGILDSGDYEINVRSGADDVTDFSDVIDEADDIGSIFLDQRSTDGWNLWTAPGGADEIGELEDGDDIVNAVEEGLLTETDLVAHDDYLVHEFDASGVAGMLVATGEDDAEAQFGALLGQDGFQFGHQDIADAGNSFDLRVRETRASAGPNVERSIQDVFGGVDAVIVDEDSNSIYIVQDMDTVEIDEGRLSGHSLDSGEDYEFEVRFRNNDVRLLDFDPDENEDVSLSDVREQIDTQYELVERTFDFDEDPYNATNSDDVVFTGETTVAPGSEFDARIRSTGDTSPRFNINEEFTVGEDRNWETSEFDLSETSVDDTFTLSLRNTGADERPEVDGTIVDAVEEDTPTPTEEETETPEDTPTEDTPEDTPTEDTPEDTPTEDTPEDTDDDTPGFGAIVALVALLAAALLATRRRP